MGHFAKACLRVVERRYAAQLVYFLGVSVLQTLDSVIDERQRDDGPDDAHLKATANDWLAAHWSRGVQAEAVFTVSDHLGCHLLLRFNRVIEWENPAVNNMGAWKEAKAAKERQDDKAKEPQHKPSYPTDGAAIVVLYWGEDVLTAWGAYIDRHRHQDASLELVAKDLPPALSGVAHDGRVHRLQIVQLAAAPFAAVPHRVRLMDSLAHDS